MKADSSRWNQFASTPYAWEQDALNFLRDQLQDVEPNRIWALFEFASPEGYIGEVDALVLTRKGFFLVEIKSNPGRLTGDAYTWTWHKPEGGRKTVDSPVLTTNRKCKKLISIIRRQKALRGHQPDKLFLQPLVFLSAENVQVELDDAGRRHVCTRTGSPRTPSLLHALTNLDENDGRRRPINKTLAAAITLALAQAGIRESQAHKRFANTYQLETLLLEGNGYQDWLAHHLSADRIKRRIRLFPIALTAGSSDRKLHSRAARREFVQLQGVQHPGILRALEFHEGEQGPGLVFEHHDEDTRLDLFLRDEADKLTLEDRLSILRQVAEAIQHAHDRRIVHRALSPQSILIRPTPNGYQTSVYNWQVSARTVTSTTQTSSLTVTQHLDALIDPAALPYIAPETQDDPTERAEHLDVFGLGGIAWLLFAGRPPAEDRAGLLDRLRRDDGLLLSSAVDNVAPAIDELVRGSTRPRVHERYQTVGQFLQQLDAVEDELTRPEDEVHDNPTAASVGQRFPGGWRIKNRLGQGSTAAVFLVERDESAGHRQCVLKLALDPDKNVTLRDEQEILTSLRHEAIVECVGELECAGHFGILLARAGEQSLALRIKKERLGLEQLQRFGDDLLSALQYLEEEGVFHRDIKPDNLGVAPRGRGDYLHLVLFDFSLAKAPLSQVQVGTRAYLDPFLGHGERRQYDAAAERWAATVTLFEMATGKLPRWGDGRTAPELTDEEVDLSDESLFPSSARAPLIEFFQRALRRNARERFDNVEEMRSAWRRAFEEIDKPAAESEPNAIALHSSVQLLGLSTRALTALERQRIETVRQLLCVPEGRVTKARGVGAVTRKELLETISGLRARFPEIQPGEDTDARSEERKPAPTPEATADAAAPIDDTDQTLDTIAQQLIPKPRSKAKKDQLPARLLRSLLFPEPTRDTQAPWPTQTEIARRHKVTTVAMHQVLSRARQRWRRQAAITQIRDALLLELAPQGGIADIREAVQWIADSFGQGVADPDRGPAARAVLRAAIEAEATRDEPRFAVSRRHNHIWLVANQNADGEPIDAPTLLRYVQDLGRQAARLADTNPLPPPGQVLEALQQVRRPAGVPDLSRERLTRLAAAAGDVAVSGKLELYPRGMPANRALKLAHGTLLGSAELTLLQIRERIQSRYPEAESLPSDREHLGRMLHEVLPDLQWDEERGTFRFQSAPQPHITGARTLAAAGSTATLPPPESPEVLEAREFDERLQNARNKFLVLTTRREEYETALRRLSERFGDSVALTSVESAFLQKLRAQTEAEEIPWQDVLAADGEPPTSPKAMDLRQIVSETASDLGDELGRDLPADRTLVLTNLGILARYGLISGVVERLRERVYLSPDREGARAGVWLLIASPEPQLRPSVDGEPVPVPGGRSDYTDVPRAWLQLRQRERA